MVDKRQKKTKKYIEKNPFEASKDIDVAGVRPFPRDFWEQFLGVGKYNQRKIEAKSGDLLEGEELNLQESPVDIEPGIDYRREIIHAEKRAAAEDQQELAVKIQEVIIELKQLMNVSQELQVEFKDIATQPQIANPGKYHVSFFEWVLRIIRAARMKVEDSAAWLAAFQSKKAKRQYWAMFKKHGTSFGLSSERVVATQTG